MVDYDALVIGAGTAGLAAAEPLRAAGMRVAIAEQELVGGLCAYWGCMPSKTLLRPGSVAWEARHGFGLGQPPLDWPETARYRNTICRDWNDAKQVDKLGQEGIAFFRGQATVSGPGRVRVGAEELGFQRLVVTTGSEAAIPPIEGLREVGYWTNREGTTFQHVPDSVLIVGGGAVGCELGQALRSFGAEVTIVEEASHLLAQERPEAAGYLQEQFEADGIKLCLGRKAVRFSSSEAGRSALLDDGTTLTAQEVLVATGRRPRTQGLGLEKLGVTVEKKGIRIDEHCRAAQNVWAAGDVTGVAGFTHVADYQAKIAVADILGHPRAASYSDIPRVTYTDPEIAAVGITRPEYAPDGMDLVSVHADLGEASRTYTYGTDLKGGLRLFADAGERVLVGAWAAGPLAGEWIQFATLAVRARVPVDVLDDTMLAFPTFTRLYLEPIKQLHRKLGKQTPS